MPDGLALAGGDGLTRAISAAVVTLYAEVYGHDRTTASTYINDNVVVCILEEKHCDPVVREPFIAALTKPVRLAANYFQT
jgi:hypothetical protein